ncbi:MAG: VWA domain-containing protein [Kurthia sp.]|nr:VWA domain-containing protein [Candidatus Kurthia equi]
MAEMGRFIQFNNEQIDARQMISYENLSKALSQNLSLELTERKLIEFNPREESIAMSVFWRHREQEITHLGRLSDIYLLSEGFWRHFSISQWMSFQQEMIDFDFPKILSQLVTMAEEFRLMELVGRIRPGTKQAFRVRSTSYLATHHHQIKVHQQKGFLAEALVNYLYIAIHEGQQKLPIGGIYDDFSMLLPSWQHVYDSQSTKQSIDIIYRLAPQIQQLLKQDLKLDFYALLDSIVDDFIPDHEHKGVACMEEGNSDEAKDTIDEVFRSWHRESEQDEGTHMRFELERGNEGKTLSDEAVQGRDEQQPTEIGTGGDSDATAKPKKDDSFSTKTLKKKYTKSGQSFGREHEQVIYEEKRMEPTVEAGALQRMAQWRLEQQPHVRALMLELRKRMAQKKADKRTHLSHGRLDAKQLLSFVTESRPRPFYKKDAPSKPLDAVFGLLIDGSASMMDKMDETKQAVLLFHDVLRELKIAHDLVVFYEDAYEATKESQPNTFEWLHKLEDGAKDAAAEIAAMEPHEDNRDGFAIRWMTERLKNRPEKHRFLLVFSDGEPSAFEYAQNGILDTAEAVIAAEKQQITVLHLFLNTDLPSEEQMRLFATIYGKQSIVADNVDQFSNLTLRTLRKILSLVVQGM